VGDIERLLELLADPVTAASLRNDGDELRTPDGHNLTPWAVNPSFR
jgi:hypothetical protein